MTLRQSFEHWLITTKGITPQYTCDDEYSDHDVRVMWEAWQGAARCLETRKEQP